MRLFVWLGIIGLLPEISAMNKSFSQGPTLSQSLPIPKPQDPTVVPGYGGTDLPESQMKSHDLNRNAQQKSSENKASQLIVETFGGREKYVLDPQTDPLFLSSNQSLSVAQSAEFEKITESSGSEKFSEEEVITCEEGGDEYQRSCSKQLEIVLKVMPEAKTSYAYCPGHERKERRGWSFHYSHWTEYCSDCVRGERVTPKKVEIVSEKWNDGCTILEGLVDKGLCRYLSATQSSKNETRMIQGEPIIRDHFEEHYQYVCFRSSLQSCRGLRERGCYQVKSVCKEKVQEQCVLWEQTYHCPTTKLRLKQYQTFGDHPFCFTGDCADTSYKANQDLSHVMSQMSVFSQAQKDLRQFSTIFKGIDRRCTRNCVNFRDCCGSGKGWGVSIHLASCDAEEKELRELRDKIRCVMVGTYCAEKALGQCIRKKTTFCCYATKLAKIIQEQGRQQVGVGFGSPEHPQCQGLTPEQLSRIDFSKVDFTDLLRDVAAHTKVPNPKSITKAIQQSMRHKVSSLSTSPKETRYNSNLESQGHGDF